MTSSLALNLPHKKGKKPGEVFINCPLCITRRGKADEDFKMGANLVTGRFHCFKCGAKNSNSSLGFLKNIELYRDDNVDLRKLKDRIMAVGVRHPFPPIDLERYSYPLDEYETPFAYQYVTEKRGLTAEDIRRLGLRVGKPFWTTGKDGRDFESNRWDGRVLFPFFEAGEPMFLVGRSINGKEPKYLNSDDDGRSKGPYVYGLDRVKDGVAILCEGIISALAAERATGITGICILGYFATPEQLIKIRTRCHTLYMCLDGGVKPEIEKRLEKQLLEYNLTVHKIRLPVVIDDQGEEKGLDPDELGPEFKKYFEDARKVSLF